MQRRLQLELWGLPPSELERLERERTASSVVTFTSNVSGVVTKKEIVEGSRIELGAMPYEVVDLSTVWVLADVYETELRFIAPGMLASLRLDAFPGRTWQGKVLFIDPMLDAQSRTAKVRLAFSNANGELRPEMFATSPSRAKAGKPCGCPPTPSFRAAPGAWCSWRGVKAASSRG